jgi:hypothetical protein
MSNGDAFKRMIGNVGDYNEVLVTPEMARWLRENSPGNRSVSGRRIEQIAASIRSGNWHQTEIQGIGLDSNYRLRNGHTRCAGVERAGLPAKHWIKVGVTEAQMRYIDIGGSRSPAHQLEFQNAIPGVLLNSGDGKRLQSMTTPIYYYAMTMRGNPVAHDIEKMAHSYGASFRWMLDNWKRPASRGSAAAAFVLLHGMCVDSAERLLDGVITGAMLSIGDPSLVLREYLLALSARGKQNRQKQDMPSTVMAKVCLAGLAENKGARLTRLTIKSPAATIAKVTGGSARLRERCGY